MFAMLRLPAAEKIPEDFWRTNKRADERQRESRAGTVSRPCTSCLFLASACIISREPVSHRPNSGACWHQWCSNTRLSPFNCDRTINFIWILNKISFFRILHWNVLNDLLHVYLFLYAFDCIKIGSNFSTTPPCRSTNANYFDPGKKLRSDLDLHDEIKPAVPPRGSTNSPPANSYCRRALGNSILRD